MCSEVSFDHWSWSHTVLLLLRRESWERLKEGRNEIKHFRGTRHLLPVAQHPATPSLWNQDNHMEWKKAKYQRTLMLSNPSDSLDFGTGALCSPGCIQTTQRLLKKVFQFLWPCLAKWGSSRLPGFPYCMCFSCKCCVLWGPHWRNKQMR